MNTFYLKKLRRKANKEFQIRYFNNDRYYVVRKLGWFQYFAVSDLGTYEETYKLLRQYQRDYILLQVYNKRSIKTQIDNIIGNGKIEVVIEF